MYGVAEWIPAPRGHDVGSICTLISFHFVVRAPSFVSSGVLGGNSQQQIAAVVGINSR